MPRTELLRLEADRLAAEAATLEGRRIVDAGAVRAQSADELVERVKALDVLTIGPSLASVEVWARQVESQQQQRLEKLQEDNIGYGAPITLQLAWRGGEIDLRQCRAFIAALDE